VIRERLDRWCKPCRKMDAKAMVCLVERCNVRRKASLAEESCPMGFWGKYEEI